MTDSIDINNPSHSDIEQLFDETHKENRHKRSKSLSQLSSIAHNQPKIIDAELIAEHIQSSHRTQVRKKLYGIARTVVRDKPSSVTYLFDVIQDEFSSLDIDSTISKYELEFMYGGYIQNILYTAASSGVEIPLPVLEKMFAFVVEYPQINSAERTVDILGSLIANNSQVADRATEILICLSDMPGENELSQQYIKSATAGLYGLLEENEFPKSADKNQIKNIIEQNKSLLENT